MTLWCIMLNKSCCLSFSGDGSIRLCFCNWELYLDFRIMFKSTTCYFWTPSLLNMNSNQSTVPTSLALAYAYICPYNTTCSCLDDATQDQTGEMALCHMPAGTVCWKYRYTVQDTNFNLLGALWYMASVLQRSCIEINVTYYCNSYN